jgi:hypothetical protein
MNDHKEAERRLIAKHAEDQEHLINQIAGFQAKADTAMAALTQKFEARMQSAELEKERDLRGLRAEKERLKVALVERDHFKAMTDNQLLTRFQDLAGDIDETARVRWDSSKESEWPCPAHVLRKSENERILKHDIIQSRIWVILFQYIFCTPFRVLGDEGKLLEKRWAEASGHGKPGGT